MNASARVRRLTSCAEPWDLSSMSTLDWYWVESNGWFMTGMYSGRELVRMLRPVPGVH
jgi:hypothetical protein